MIEIRKFRLDESEALAAFIGTHWQSGHVLSRHQGLLDWQHGDANDYAYLGAWQDGEPVAILGYIATRRYDPALAGEADNVLWLALWKVREDVRIAGLGLRLLTELGRIEPNAALAVVGINPDHLAMYRALKYVGGDVPQYVMFRRGARPALAEWPREKLLPVGRAGRARLQELDVDALDAIDPRFEIGERAAQLPRKTGRYFASRYLRHPYYSYRVHALELNGLRGLLASRLAVHDQARALRLVDWYGDPRALAEAGGALAELIEECGAEYADIWQHGIDGSLLAAAGFARVDPDGPAIVPTLFEPFVRQNRRLQFAFKSRDGRGCVVMRADGDQDRPNLLGLAA